MIAQNRNFRVSFDSLLDDLLIRICAKLQLSPTQHDEAVARYGAVGKWLLNPSSGLAHLNPRIYPQGSLRIGTPVKPVGQNEYDLDLVCEMDFDWRLEDPLRVLDALEKALRDHGTYQDMVRRKNRCIRLVYANEFHLDILPGSPNLQGPNGAIKVPDRASKSWKDSNPIGYGDWFERKASPIAHFDAKDIEPVPDRETMAEKPPLKFAVQLMKRHRDLEFKDSLALAPISILLTTLAGHHYGGERSIGASLMSIMTGINNSFLSLASGQRLTVLNPANPEEDLSERWDEDEKSYPLFLEWASGFWAAWQDIHGSRGRQLFKKLQTMFGEEVTEAAMKDQVAIFGQHRVDDHLGVTGPRVSLAVGTASAVVIPVKKNTFYG
jgi:hypothetical protein